jgi:predicted lipoprotein with Yx(FWY)xxD motif
MMLFDGTGQTIYLLDKEQTTKPQCYGACAKAWPPVLTKGTPIAADGTNRASSAPRSEPTVRSR